ncbi:MAG: tRNA (adenosine(37)-N6)-threonylcarbamoyltransferase complex dimerization subunit type 1 TsaB [Betaproteobacteria bacterium HGW-Betaproteobacteria-3]|nr:MAG: tRNA (adenosine(37)-N6)-threonylcarbamoyltransferase complex dimerization subunit type 1 TsaB [Betaproteobacteria bacterium HGW-Betaproteobacteria-3]
MKLLAFDTSTETLSVAVAHGGGLWQHTGAGGAQASATLIPTVLALLAQAGLTLADLDAIVFGRGPGAFTGLRTACAVAQGLAYGARGGLGVPVLPVDTLLAVAEQARGLWAQAHAFDATGAAATGAAATDDPLARSAPCDVIALLDARMDQVYAAHYRYHPSHPSIAAGSGGTTGGASPAPQGAPRWTRLGDIQLLAPEAVLRPEGAWLAGNAFAAYGPRLPGGPRIDALPTATALLRLAPALLAAGGAVPAEQALPLYVRDNVAKTTAERAAERAAILQQ